MTTDHTPWMPIALAELGMREAAGDADNPRVVEYLRGTRLPARMHRDATPWCAAYVGWCLQQAGVAPTGSAAARSYLRWGDELDQPRVGAIAVLTREGAPGSGHVGFVHRIDSDRPRIWLLGGNQSNAVTISAYARSRVISYRWPHTVYLWPKPGA